MVFYVLYLEVKCKLTAKSKSFINAESLIRLYFTLGIDMINFILIARETLGYNLIMGDLIYESSAFTFESLFLFQNLVMIHSRIRSIFSETETRVLLGVECTAVSLS
jgi:hypothetical protein